MLQKAKKHINAFARKKVHGALSKITTGKLVLFDVEGRTSFGDDDENPVVIDIHLPNNEFYQRLITGGSIALGEMYIEGGWSTRTLTDAIRLLLKNEDALGGMDTMFSKVSSWLMRKAHISNTNTKEGSKSNILAHYDVGNEFYRLFLDSSMMYSAGYFNGQTTELYDAQEDKLHRICEQLGLQNGDSIIEIGTGWGGFAVFAAQNYNVHVTTTTISDEQHAYVSEMIWELGLSGRITLLKEDYRDLAGQYDKLVSIEMIEAVGHEHLPTFFNKCNSLLKDDGKMVLQSIIIDDKRYDRYKNNVDFIQRYIFPGGFLPSMLELSTQVADNTDMRITDVKDLGIDYAITLKLWSDNLFLKRDEALEALKHGSKGNNITREDAEQNYRLWEFYFAYCEGGFRERTISVLQLAIEKQQYFDVERYDY